jgi:hypothetical protein
VDVVRGGQNKILERRRRRIAKIEMARSSFSLRLESTRSHCVPLLPTRLRIFARDLSLSLDFSASAAKRRAHPHAVKNRSAPGSVNIFIRRPIQVQADRRRTNRAISAPLGGESKGAQELPLERAESK